MVEKQEALLTFQGILRFQILHELREQRLCGDDLAQILGEKKEKKLTPGTIYPALKFLRKKKLVKHRKYGRKKIYTMTEKGEEEYQKIREEFTYLYKHLIKTSKK